jgi:uncharacterized protein DUF3616
MQAKFKSIFARASRSPILLLSALILLGLGGPQRGFAADDVWDVDNKLVGKKGKHSRDVSGIACLPGGPPRKCLVIDDEVQFAQFVIVEKDSLIAGDTVDLVDSDTTPWNIDGEGVTVAAAGVGKPDTFYFYVIGSHGHPRDKCEDLDSVGDAAEIKARYDASSVLVRLPVRESAIDNEGKLKKKAKDPTHADLRPMIYLEPKLEPLRPFLGKRLDEDQRGLNFEGVAAVDGRLYVGLRAPTLRPDGTAAAPQFPDERAAIFSFDRDAPFDGTPANAKLDLLALGKGRGIRDLTVHGNTILILAGPAYEGCDSAKVNNGDYSIYSWDRSSDPKLLLDLDAYEEKEKKEKKRKPLKPEALVVLNTKADGRLDILVLFDGAREGGPRQVTTEKK